MEGEPEMNGNTLTHTGTRALQEIHYKVFSSVNADQLTDTIIYPLWGLYSTDPLLVAGELHEL